MGVDTPKCYHAMPVALEEEDLAEYAEFAGLTLGQAANVTFFVEPYTRVLTTTAAEAPCVPGLSPMYEALDGSWVQATPTLRRMTGPQAINSSEFMNYELLVQRFLLLPGPEFCSVWNLPNRNSPKIPNVPPGPEVRGRCHLLHQGCVAGNKRTGAVCPTPPSSIVLLSMSSFVLL